jgi:hypothetical protein
MNPYETLSFCGIYCGGCKNYKENMNCAGCRYEKQLVDDCPTRSCAIKRGFLHCGECENFPCNDLNDFYKDGIPHHELALQNMLKIKENGIEKWLFEQEKEHTCECGRKKAWFATKCIHEANHK